MSGIEPDDLVDELSAWMETRLAGLHTVTVGRVVRFNVADPSADVQPLLKRTYVREGGEREVVTLPVISRAPVVYPRGGGWSQTWPLAPGDLVLLLVAERSLDRWSASADGAEVSPADPRRHDLSDAVVLAGIAPWRRAPVVDPAAMVLRREPAEGETGPHAEVRLQPDGQVLLGEGAVLGVAREGDQVQIDATTAPDLYALLNAASGLTGVAVPSTITGRISSASTRIKAT